jgi:hypothetical protein
VQGGNFVLGLVDPQALHLPAAFKRIAVADGTLKLKNASTDKTELKLKLERGCLQVSVREGWKGGEG